MHIKTGMPTTVYWYMAFINKLKYKKRIKIFKKQAKKLHTFANMQHCWQHYIPHPHSNLVFPISGFSFIIQNDTGGTLKLLNCIQWYSSKHI